MYKTTVFNPCGPENDWDDGAAAEQGNLPQSDYE